MQRPSEPRIACYQRALLTLLNADRRAILCHAVELSGRSMRIVLDEPVPPATPISIQIGDWIALGEVRYSRREYSHFAAGLELDQITIGVSDLDKLRRNRLNERPSAPPGLLFTLHKTK